MKLAALTLIGSAAAFAPAQTGKATTVLNAFEGELGAQAPLGFFGKYCELFQLLEEEVQSCLLCTKHFLLLMFLSFARQ